jgi:hypothetical protein
VKHDRTGQVTAPAFPYQRDIKAVGTSRREQLSSWLTSKDNQYFAKSYVNRLWGYLFGRGIIEPIDDIRAGNPPTNPELLDAMSRDFIESGFDMRHILRTICQSRVYQLSVKTNPWNKDDEINHARALPRRLPAEVLFDAIHVATGSTPRVPGAPAGARAAELPDAGVSVPFLEDFGRPVRESACECERSSGMVLGPVMKLINGPTVADAIADPANRLTKLVAEQPDDRVLIEEVFLRFLARKPTPAEVELGLEAIRNAGSDHERITKTSSTRSRPLGRRRLASPSPGHRSRSSTSSRKWERRTPRRTTVRSWYLARRAMTRTPSPPRPRSRRSRALGSKRCRTRRCPRAGLAER